MSREKVQEEKDLIEKVPQTCPPLLILKYHILVKARCLWISDTETFCAFRDCLRCRASRKLLRMELLTSIMKEDIINLKQGYHTAHF